MSEISNPPFQIPERNEENLFRHYRAEAGPIKWRELEYYFANGSVIFVDAALDITEVALRMALDDRKAVEEWMKQNLVSIVSDEKARHWNEGDSTVLAVTVPPWILVQG
jgi:hypothetical protein